MDQAYKRYGKRILDLLVIILTLPLLVPVTILVLLAYLVTADFPVLFVQERLGLGGRPFLMMKFRTLRNDSSLLLQKRRFFLGDLLRRTHLDELPQLWHVLRGQMSLVGPRALPVEYDLLFSPAQRERFLVKPGLTGLAQISGRHSIPWAEKLEWDRKYVSQMSWRLDLAILIHTILLILAFKEDKSLEEEKFKGN